MRSGLVIIGLLLLSCAGAGTSATEPASPVAPLSLRAGDRFDVLHVERVRLDDREVFIRRTRFALEIREPHGVSSP